MTDKDSLNINYSDSIFLLQNSNQSEKELTELKVNTIKDLTDRVSYLEKRNNQLSYSDYISGISLLLSLLTSISLLSYFLYTKHQKRQIKRSRFLTGKWTSEGDITDPQPQPYLDFELEVDNDDGEITGVFTPNNNHYPIVLSINGKLRNKKATIDITHVSQQRLLTYGKAELKLVGKLIKWKLKRGEKELFPKSSIVWKI